VNTLMGHISSETTFNGLIADFILRCRSWLKLWKNLKIHAMRRFEVIEFEMAYATSYWWLSSYLARFPSYGEISVKFCTEIRRWLTYTVAKKYCENF